MKPYKTYETDRLLIRPTDEDDAPFIFELMTSPQWLKNIGSRGIHTVDEAREYIRVKMLPHLERLGFGNYTVVRKTDGACVGTCGLNDRPGLDGIDIGYAFLERYQRQGYAFEAAQRIKQAAFDDFSLTGLLAITTFENLPSQRILEKLGMRCIGSVYIEKDPKQLKLYQINAQADSLE